MAKRKTDGYGNYVGDSTGLDIILGSLPPIAGCWYFVDPTSGSASNDGLTPSSAFANIRDAYNACTSGAGDGIAVFSRGTTSAATTSYLKYPLAWAKSGIYVYGVAAPTRVGGRARIANAEAKTSACETIAHAAHAITREAGSFLTDGWTVGCTGVTVDSGSNNGATFTVTAVSALSMTISETFNVQAKASVGSCTMTSYIAQMLLVTGSNNTFENLLIGNYSSHALSLGGVKLLSCDRNAFIGCQIIGAGHATPGAVATQSSVRLDEATECLFKDCTIGTDTVKKASASGEIAFNSTVTGGGAAITARIKFENCDILSWSDTSTKVGLISDSAISLARVMEFVRCRFINWDEGAMTNLASVFGGTAPTSGKILLDACTMHGYAVWDSVANAVMYCSNGAIPAATGGLAIKAA